MYPISDYVKKLYRENRRQVVEIIFHGKNRTFTMTESDIRQGGLSIDRYCVSNTKIEIGSAIAAELTLTLENTDDRFADEVFEDAELEVKIGVKKWDAGRWENAKVEWIPCGFFTIDDPPRKLTSITISALDRMVKFDEYVTDSVFPNTVENLIKICCDRCGVPLYTDVSKLPNSGYLITYSPEEDEELTYRQLIQWAAQLTGTCAYIDWNGKLRLEWYSDTDINITPSDRYSSDLYENDIVITGVQITDADDNIYLAGTDDYAFNIAGNKLITHDYEDVLANLYKVLGGFTYRPYSCTVKPMPFLYPLDRIRYIDKNKVVHNTIITNTTFKMNLSNEIAGKGETVKKNSYSSQNPLTPEQSIVIQKVKKQVAEGYAEIRQEFTAADGLLRSAITAEIARAEGVEEVLSSTIQQTSEAIILEVTRATGAEETLSSQLKITSDAIAAEVERATTEEGNLKSSIKATADAITAEVTRAQGAEETLSSQLKITSDAIAAKVSATGGDDKSFSWSLTADGFTLKADNDTVMEVTSSGLKVSGDITASTGNIAGLIIDKKSGTISKVTKHTESKEIMLSSPSSAAVEDYVPGWYYLYGNIETYTLADLDVTTPNAILGKVIIQDATSTNDGMGIVDLNSKSVSFSAYIRAKMTSGTVRVKRTVTFDYYTVENTTSTFSSLHSADDTFNLKSAESLSKSAFTIGNAMVSEADIVKLSSTDAYIGGLHITDKAISYSSCGFRFDENWGDNYTVSVSYMGNTILLYINGGSLPYEKTFEVQYKETGSNVARIKSITVAAGSNFAEEQVPIFSTISEAYLISGGYLTSSYNFTAGSYKKAIQAYGGNFISSGTYSSTYYARIGDNLGDDENWWNNLYVVRVYLQQLYQAGSLISLSDRNEKFDIKYYNDEFDAVFDELKPATFKFNKGESGRTHIGLIAQDVKETLEKLDVPTTDFAAYCEWTEHETIICGLRYEELIPLCISQIQKLKQEIQKLKQQSR